jgi:pyruvate kinase
MDTYEALLINVRDLRVAVASEGRATYERWRARIAEPGFASAALNLAHYLALRHRDIRPMQRDLMSLGLSSLGRLEGRVLASFDAVIASLSAVTGEGTAMRRPSPRQFFRGERHLRANTKALFGPPGAGREGRILVTLPSEAADAPDLIERLARAGMDSVRINCAHDGPEAWLSMIAHVRRAEGLCQRKIAILMDIAGPKLRTGAVCVPIDGARLKPGDALVLTKAAPAPGAGGFQAACLPAQILDRIEVGAAVLLDDGKLRGIVTAKEPERVTLRVERTKPKGFKLKPERGLNFPNTDLGLGPLTDNDLAALDIITAHADMIGYSFVETAEDIVLLQKELALRRKDWRKLGLVAKIETPTAVRNLPEIIVEAAGRQPFAVMIARGDLAVELGFERLAEMQEEILWLCEAAHVPVIWATQVLENLIRSGLPTRAEMTDAAMGVRAECVMLNKGEHLVQAIAAVDALFRRMGEHQLKKTPTLRALRSW